MNKTVDIFKCEIETTNRCNLNCSHCLLYEDDEKGTDYSDYITKEIIDEFFKKDIRMIRNLNFTGGEPLLNTDIIIYTIDKIIKEKIKVIGIDIATNGTILDKRFIDALNRFTEYSENEFFKGMEVKKLANLRISRLYHNNDFKKAFDFYQKRANKLINVKIIEDEKITESKKVPWGRTESIRSLAYSGRAKKLDVEYFCDSPRHKIVYDEETKGKFIQCVKCPLKLMSNGDLSIGCYCTIKDAHKNAFGNVNDDKNLSEMITEWNYKTPLTCDEACKLEEVRMYYETKRQEDISRLLNKDISVEDLEEMVAKEESKCFYIEQYRLLLHDKLPCLTSDEIEQISHIFFDLESKKENKQLSEEEIVQETERLDNHISRLVWEHSFDDVKNIHEEFPFLTHDECVEIGKCYEICRLHHGNVSVLTYPYLKRGMELTKLNEYREKNEKSIF